MPLSKVVLLSFITLITMVNPLAVIPSFVALTDRVARAGRAQRRADRGDGLHRRADRCFWSRATGSSSSSASPCPAFQIMGGIIFFTNALRTLVEEDERRAFKIGGEKRMEEHDVERGGGRPHLDRRRAAGHSDALRPRRDHLDHGAGQPLPRLEQKIAVAVAIVGVGIASYVVLLGRGPALPLIGHRGRAVFTKVMALLLGAIGIQFIINGLKPVLMEIIRAS